MPDLLVLTICIATTPSFIYLLQIIEFLICGANEENYHYRGLNISRDCGAVEYIDVSKIKTGGICPNCGKKTIQVKRGIEVGNIFQLGTKYSKAMNMTYTDADGAIRNPLMGCYGIGIGRLAASICEARHDENGPIWPISIAPWQVHLCCMRVDQEICKSTSDNLYTELLTAGIEVIYDDRDVRAGTMFADADLLGVELVLRDKSFSKLVDLKSAISEIKMMIGDLFAMINSKVDS